jgi:hypothetical protein
MGLTYRGSHKLDDLIFSINKPLIGKKGIHYQKLLRDWSLIVGENVSRKTVPTKISSYKKQNIITNTLYIAANNSAVIAELVYHIGVITEQINFYFGYEYISKLKFTQATFEVKHQYIQRPSKISDEKIDKLNNIIDTYEEDDEIKTLLKKLGTSILQKN